jgi:ATP-binding cassette subfamily C (CFTR/MRP) protein 1
MVDGAKLRTRVMNDEQYTNSTQFILFATSYGLSIIIFALENLERPKSQYIMLEDDEVY